MEIELKALQPKGFWAKMTTVTDHFIIPMQIHGIDGQEEKLMEDRKQAGISINELANYIQGEILNSSDKTDELVESLMVGAMCIDPAPLYFNTKSNKAVITRSDRADIQLGALETSTACLILTGGTKPSPVVMQRAEEKGVPVLLVERDTPAILSELEQQMSQLAPEIPVPEDGTSAEPEES